jgi:hypothetical protein
MKLRTLTALLSTGALALSLAACGTDEKEDDTGDSDTDTTGDNDEDDCTEDTTFEEDEDCYCDYYPEDELCEDEPDGLSVDVLYMQYEVTLRDYQMVPYLYEDEPYDGFVYFWFANGEDWEGTDDVENACVVAYNLNTESGTEDVDLGSDAWWGWEIDTTIPEDENTITSLAGWSESCEDIDNLDLAPWEIVDSHTWGFGVGPMSSDLEAALSDAWGADWETYGPSAFGGYVNIDAGTEGGGIGEWSYGIAFEIDADNNLIVNDDNTLELIEVGDDGNGGVGYFRAFPAYGIDVTAL